MQLQYRMPYSIFIQVIDFFILPYFSSLERAANVRGVILYVSLFIGLK